MTKRNGKLRLYHYTFSRNLFGLHLGGLEPHKYDPPTDLLTMGQPVVWLTTQTTLTPTPSDLEHVRNHRQYEGLPNASRPRHAIAGQPVNAKRQARSLAHMA
jgi:hypothetical protein